MNVKVLFFHTLRQAAGTPQVDLSLPEGTTLAGAIAAVRSQFPGIEPWLPSLLTAVNRQWSPPETSLTDGDEIALMPPVSGG